MLQQSTVHPFLSESYLNAVPRSLFVVIIPSPQSHAIEVNTSQPEIDSVDLDEIQLAGGNTSRAQLRRVRCSRR
jgi:hypothetical protein